VVSEEKNKMKTLRDRRLKPSENSPELEESIQRLTHLGYLTAPRDVTEALAKDYFTDHASLVLLSFSPMRSEDFIKLDVHITETTAKCVL
jgi:hypothetical protein